MKTMSKIYLKLLAVSVVWLCWALPGFAQCPATGPTVYSVAPGAFTNAGNQLQTIDPVTGVGTHVNGPGADLAISTTAIAWDPIKGKIWYSTEQPGGSGSRICSYDLATNTNTPATEGAGYQFIKNGTVVNPGMVNKAAYNPVDGMIYFHSVTPVFDNQGLYRLNPANPAAGAVYVGKLSVDGAVEGGTFTSTSDIVFDAQGNMTSVLGNSNNLVVFKAQYDASGVYQGVNIAGQSFAGTSITPAAMGFLPDGNYIVAGAGQTGTINSSTGVFTAHSPAGSSSSDYASCAVPTVNINAQKTAIRNCANRTITYTITVQNTGTAHAYDAMLKDAAPSGLTLTGGTMNGITLIGSQLTGLSGSGLPLRTPGSLIDGILMKGSTATVVLNYTYDAASDGASFSNQGFVTYAGVQTLNLPNNQIPTDDPSTATPADPTAITQCSANASASCPTEIYTVGSLSPTSTFSYKELFVLDPVTFSVVRDYPLPYNGTNGVGTYSIAVPGDGFAYTVSWTQNPNAAARTIYKTNLSATPNAAATVSTGIVLPAINGPSGSYYISGTADKEGNIYFSSDHGNALIQVTPTGTVNTIWNSANPVTVSPTPTPPAGATFTGDFKDLTIDAVGDYYFVEDYTKRIWQVPKGTTTAIYRGTADVGNNVAADIIFLNGEMYIVTSGGVSAPIGGPTRIFKINRTTMVGTEVVRPAGQNQIFADAASATCTLISLAPFNGKVLNDNNGQTDGVNGTPVAGATVTLYAADGVTVIATTTTDADGNYHFNNTSPNTTYVVGVTPPAGFNNVSSSDGTTPMDGKTTISTPSGGNVVASIDFGVNQPPTAVGSTLPGQANPGGTTNVTIPATAFSGTDPNSGTIASMTITEFPTNATSITINGTTYTSSTFPAGGINVPTDAAGNPQQTIAIDPADGAVSPVITFTVTDNAGLVSPAATVTVPFTVDPPVATNDSSTGNTPGDAVTQNILANDTLSNGAVATAANTTVALNTTGLPAGSTVSADGHTVTVPGEGTWVYDPATGDLTFTPLATFTGNPTPVPYTLTETATGLSDTATAAVTYNKPPVATNDSSTGNTPGDAVTQNILANDTLSTGAVATAANTTVALNTTGLPAGSTVSADGHTVTVPGEGTWVYDLATGDLTFTPLATFTGNPTPVPYTLTETATGLSDTATAAVTYNTPPVATNDSSTGNTPGDAVTQNILANDTLSTGAVATAANTTVALNTTGLPAGSTVSADGHTVTVPGEGTWVYDPATGDLTFTPPATFTGNPTPVPYTLTETVTGLSDTATASVTYNKPPVATNDSSTGNTPGDAVTQNILANDTLSNGAVATAANTTVALNTTGLPAGSTVSADGHTVTVPGEGTWVYDQATGDLTFTPLATFTGNPTSVSYTLTETATGLSDTATAAVTYNKPPVATNDSSTGNTPGDAVTQNILANDTLSTGALATAANTTVALNTTGLPAGSTVSADGHTVTVPGEGTWVYDPATGNLTFTPLATFTGNPTSVSYTLTETATGLSDTATAAVSYNKPPVATNDSSTGNTPGDAVTQNILANDTLSNGAVATAAKTTVALNTTGLPAGSTVSADGHTVTVPGEGTWVYDPATGDLTFMPLATFTGNPMPVPYTLTETATGLSDTATAAVTYSKPPVATNDSSTGNTPGAAVTQNILANDTLSTGAVATAANTTVALNTTGLPAGSTVSADGHTVTVPGEGTWVYDPATGDLTFTPLATFTGNPTSVSYTLTETATGLSDTATAAVSYDQGIVFDYGDLPYTGAAVNYPKVKAQFKDANGDHVPDDAAAVWLGQIIDAEADGFTNPANPADYAKGDDKSGAADEDGLKVDGGMTPGTKKWVITGNSNQPATVHYGMWIDWGTPTAGPDGTFDAFYSGTVTTASPANDTVTVTIPATFLKGSLVNIRVIASTAPLDQATGFSTNVTNGEVEDYQMTYEEALPVRLVSFQGSASESDAVLTWKAADQVDFDRYEIERSADGKQFSLVGTQLSNNLKAGDYRFTDKGAASVAATLYYRLKIVDTDGSYAYSSIRAVAFQDAAALTAAAWPTLIAAGETVNVSLAGHKGSYQVTMFSEGGRQILERKGQAATGTVQLPTQGLPFGTYLIKVTCGGWQKTLKIAIVK